MLAALRCVDYVTLFAEHTAEVVVAALQPDYYVKGGDYARAPGVPDAAVDEDRLPEARVARASGGQVVLLPYRAGYSTSALIERIVRSASEG
jgi:bifunctional ADP-heptose synthase (sugar kinase/adenylyltransferase)